MLQETKSKSLNLNQWQNDERKCKNSSFSRMDAIKLRNFYGVSSPKTFSEKKNYLFGDVICMCTCQRRYSQTTGNFTRSSQRRLQYAGLNRVSKILSCCRTSATKSLRFCLCGFIIWTLVIGPILTDVVQELFHSGYGISFGGATLANACRPGHVIGGGKRQPPAHLNPFQRGEFIPKMSEHTIGASGPAEGAIHRDSERFRDELTSNWNPDIIFKDEEETNEDRFMTERCLDRLNILAVSVATQWPGVKLRVTEGWDNPDTQRIHPTNSLHYEGRAVDITTSDEDRAKYSILARLAVNAGFDWVHYDTTYVHCSVKSESSDAARYGGCFPGDALVQLPGIGYRRMDDLQLGDKVLAINSNGKIVTDSIVTFMDVQTDHILQQNMERTFISLTTDEGTTVRLTRNHLIYVSAEITNSTSYYDGDNLYVRNHPTMDGTFLSPPSAVFAGKAQVGQYLHVVPDLSTGTLLRPSRIVKVKTVTSASGAYAPLTTTGTILVDNVMTSCYAVIESDFIAHIVMSPVRYFHQARLWVLGLFQKQSFTRVEGFKSVNETIQNPNNLGISLYSKIFYNVGSHLFPETMFWGD